METVSVTAANTVCIRPGNTYIRIINHNGNGKDMPVPMNNDIKTPAIMKNTPKTTGNNYF
jgi:hypothetical protein